MPRHAPESEVRAVEEANAEWHRMRGASPMASYGMPFSYRSGEDRTEQWLELGKKAYVDGKLTFEEFEAFVDWAFAAGRRSEEVSHLQALAQLATPVVDPDLVHTVWR